MGKSTNTSSDLYIHLDSLYRNWLFETGKNPKDHHFIDFKDQLEVFYKGLKGEGMKKLFKYGFVDPEPKTNDELAKCIGQSIMYVKKGRGPLIAMLYNHLEFMGV